MDNLFPGWDVEDYWQYKFRALGIKRGAWKAMALALAAKHDPEWKRRRKGFRRPGNPRRGLRGWEKEDIDRLLVKMPGLALLDVCRVYCANDIVHGAEFDDPGRKLTEAEIRARASKLAAAYRRGEKLIVK